MKYLAAAVQCESKLLDREYNVAHLEEWTRKAAAMGAKLIVLPEMGTSGYYFASRAEAESVAEEIPGGPTVQRFIALAKELDAEIVSCDSMQVYRHMDIGSAKIRPEEMQGVKHYLVDVLEPDEEFHVVRFQQMAKEAMKEIYAKGKVPIVVGGTGFYIQALLYDIDFTESNEDTAYRTELEELAVTHGPQYLHDMLKEKDPKAAESIHANNVKRVIRALEFHKQTGEKISEHNEEERQKESPYDFCYFVLND